MKKIKLKQIIFLVALGLISGSYAYAQQGRFSEVRFKISPPKSRIEILGKAPDSVSKILESIQGILIPPICPVLPSQAVCNFSLEDVSGPANDFKFSWSCPASLAPCDIKMNSKTISQVAGAGRAYWNLDNIIERTPIFELINVKGGFCGGGIAHTYTTGTTASRPSATVAATFSQSAYRWLGNLNSATPDTALADQDTAYGAGVSGQLRLRLLIHVAGSDLGVSGQAFKLQTGANATCSAATYADVSGSSSYIRYYNNASPVDGAAISTVGDDPTHSGHTRVAQTYEEANNFTNTSGISTGQDGLWDFSLLMQSGAGFGNNICLRAVKSDGTVLDTYSVYAETSCSGEGCT